MKERALPRTLRERAAERAFHPKEAAQEKSHAPAPPCSVGAVGTAIPTPSVRVRLLVEPADSPK